MDETHEGVGAVARSVETVELDGQVARRTTLRRHYPTPPADLWQALTEPDRIRRWFLPVSGDLHEGGHYQLEGNAHGVIERCEPPRGFRLSWLFGEGMTSWVTVTLTPEESGTQLFLEHVGHVPEEFWAQFGPGATGVGWDLSFHGLGLHLASGTDLDPAAMEVWTTSPEGLAFVRHSSDAWAEAAVADGAPPEEAAACAARTFAFYTGEAEPPAG